MRSGEQFRFNSAFQKPSEFYSFRAREARRPPRRHERHTFQPPPNVVKGRSVRDIVQNECGICATIVHRSLRQGLVSATLFVAPCVQKKCSSGRTIERNRSCPAVSHSCSRTRMPSTYTFLVTKNAPVVDLVFLGSYLFWV